MKKFNPKDHYFKKAKELDYKARSVFKLEEIDQKWKLLRSGQTLLDLGCAPGSWSQFALKKVGPSGQVIGIDLKTVDLKSQQFTFFQKSIEDLSSEDLSPLVPNLKFDGVLSDMAPATTGIKSADQARSLDLCQMAFQSAQRYLKPNGFFVVKIFEGPEMKTCMSEVKERFGRVELFKPQSTRSISKEIFLVGLQFKGSNAN